MFTFDPRPTFTAPVTVHAPGAAGPQTFTAHFQALPDAETDVLQGAQVPADRIPESNRLWLAKILIGWEGITDDSGDLYLFSAENRDALLGSAWLRGPVTIAYLTGISGAARKN